MQKSRDTNDRISTISDYRSSNQELATFSGKKHALDGASGDVRRHFFYNSQGKKEPLIKAHGGISGRSSSSSASSKSNNRSSSRSSSTRSRRVRGAVAVAAIVQHTSPVSSLLFSALLAFLLQSRLLCASQLDTAHFR